MSTVLPHNKRTYIGKNGHSYCSFCEEESTWCECARNCKEGYHNWSDNQEVCVYCLVKKEEVEDI